MFHPNQSSKKPLQHRKTGKLQDEIPAEFIKADVDKAANMLYSLFSKIWEKEEEHVLAQWRKRLIIKLPKNGDLRKCWNYRRIILMSVSGKVLNRVLLKLKRAVIDLKIWDLRQCGQRDALKTDDIDALRNTRKDNRPPRMQLSRYELQA